MIGEITKVYEDIKTRILMNKLDTYENLIEYYFERADMALAEKDYISYSYWSNKITRCLDEYLEAVSKHKDLLM